MWSSYHLRTNESTKKCTNMDYKNPTINTNTLKLIIYNLELWLMIVFISSYFLYQLMYGFILSQLTNHVALRTHSDVFNFIILSKVKKITPKYSTYSITTMWRSVNIDRKRYSILYIQLSIVSVITVPLCIHSFPVFCMSLGFFLFGISLCYII